MQANMSWHGLKTKTEIRLWRIVNTGDDPKALKDYQQGAISVDDYDLEEGGLTVLFPGGTTVGTKEADVLAAYGEPTDSYKDEEYEILITGMTKKVTTTHVQLKQR